MKTKKQEISQSSNRRYCCYRHFIEGKPAKDSTYCYSHVPLGVINPIPQQKPIPRGQIDGRIQIIPKRFRIQKQTQINFSRTHDYNEIQHKFSLPKRLTDPKVYIQKLVPKNTHNPFSLQSTKQIIVRSRFYESQYDILFSFLKKIGRALPNPSKQTLQEVIVSFMRKHDLKAHEKILPIAKQDFINLMLSQFTFTQKDADEFWDLVYNDRRFKSSKYDNLSKTGQIISMQAFIHNFDRFYLRETQKFVNLLSEAALKQRVIDIRHFLHDWYKFNIFYKLNMIQQTNRELLICEYLRKFGQNQQSPSDNQSLYSQMLDLIQKRNYQHLKIRIISKFIYSITDDKYLSYEKLHETIRHKIEEETKLLETSMKIIKNFLEMREYTSDQKFGMPEIVEYMRDESCEESEFLMMSRYLRRLIKYLYFNKMENAEYGIYFVRDTLKFECENILELSPQILVEFSEFVKQNTQTVSGILLDSFMNYLQNQIMENFHHKVQATNMQNQQKIMVMECNFLAEGIKRFLLNSDLVCFRTLITIADAYAQICEEGAVNLIRQIIDQEKRLNNESIQVRKAVKEMFKLNDYPTSDKSTRQNMRVEGSPNLESLHDKFESYKNAGKLATEVQATLKNPAKQKKQSQEQNINGIFIPEMNSPELLEIQNQLKVTAYEENSKNGQPAHSCCGSHRIYCTDISMETINSISAVQSLEDKLFDLLGL